MGWSITGSGWYGLLGRTRGRLSPVLATALVTATLVLAAPAARGATPEEVGAPSNDDFAQARTVSGPLPITVGGTLAGSTDEPGEPAHAGVPTTETVWFRWTATQSGPIKMDTCASADEDTLIAVYTGSQLAALTPVVSGDDTGGCATLDPKVVFTADAGTTYQIAVAGQPGAGRGDITLRIAVPPANDDFADAAAISGALPVTVHGSNVDATSEPAEPTNGDCAECLPLSTVWWTWVPDRSMRVTLDPCGSGFNPAIGVYTGNDLATLERVPLSPSACNAVTFSAAAGTTYRISVSESGYLDRPEGTIALTIRAPHPPPANDDLADATRLHGSLPLRHLGSNVDATAEPGEPQHQGRPATSSVWYAWTANRSGPVTIDLCESLQPTRLGVYTGTTMATLAAVRSENTFGCHDGGSYTRSQITFRATERTRYLIAVDGTPGTHQLRIRWADRPPNDAFADAQVLTGTLPINVRGSNVDATFEPGEPQHTTPGTVGGATVWYRWTATASQPVAVQGCGSDFAAAVGVYRGSAVDALSRVPAQRFTCGAASGLIIHAVAGTTYRIAVDGDIDGQGAFILTIRRAAAPANDDFADALPLDATVTGTNVDASAEPGEPQHAFGVGYRGSRSVWYRWTPRTSGAYVLDTCGSTLRFVVLALYTGNRVDDLTPVARTSGQCSHLVVRATASTRYRIAVDSLEDQVGTFAVHVHPITPAANDAFADPQVLPALLPVRVPVNNLDASREPGEPLHGVQPGEDPRGSEYGGRSVWFTWTPTTSGRVVIGGGLGLTTVYTGTTLADLSPVASVDGYVLRLDVTAGTTYRIATDAPYGVENVGELSIRRPAPPANDDFAAAQVLSGGPLPVTVTGTNADATAEQGEPMAAYGAGSTVWYRWTARANRTVAVDTCGTPEGRFVTIGVFTGSSVDQLTAVHGSTGLACDAQDRWLFDATAGTTYYIAVDDQPGGGAGAGGPFTLNLSCLRTEPGHGACH